MMPDCNTEEGVSEWDKTCDAITALLKERWGGTHAFVLLSMPLVIIDGKQHGDWSKFQVGCNVSHKNADQGDIEPGNQMILTAAQGLINSSKPIDLSQAN